MRTPSGADVNNPPPSSPTALAPGGLENPCGLENPWLNPESLFPKAPSIAPRLPCPSLTPSFLVARAPAEQSPGRSGLCEGLREAWGVVTLSPRLVGLSPPSTLSVDPASVLANPFLEARPGCGWRTFYYACTAHISRQGTNTNFIPSEVCLPNLQV